MNAAEYMRDNPPPSPRDMPHAFEPYDVSPQFCVICDRRKDDPRHVSSHDKR